MTNLNVAECRTYFSSDSVCPTESTSDVVAGLHTPELLNGLKCSGLPNHCLTLKIGSPAMLLRNIDPSAGLCNGTRLIITRLADHVVEAKLLFGNAAGSKVLIPRQMLSTVGLLLRKPVFVHGQLYVALSRVSSPRGLKLLIRNEDENCIVEFVGDWATDSPFELPEEFHYLCNFSAHKVAFTAFNAPRLGSLTLQYYCNDDDIDDYVPILPVSLDLSFIHTLCLDFNFKPFKLFASELTRWGPELNVECVELYDVNVLYDDDFSSFIHSLLICPKLRKLDIYHLYFYAEISRSILWEELQSAAKVLKMLHTFKLRLFNGSRFELQFIEVLLACFPALEKVVIIRHMEFDSNEEFEIMQKFFHFPRASKKAKIVYI
ncbi:PREDICTED: uncharacterized protein LOC109188696 [Ipomoea nil]|uniref:uncharacterized protein LOC109188696 n=1 Tax=Ipomoea nil TaxID=35883 RepID=UPI000901458E|nr:PREDICTED: uncharacterized protein LOC109188696 [Ipomoea nil]